MVIFTVLILTVLAFAGIALPFFQQTRRDFWSVIGVTPADTSSGHGPRDVMLKQLEADFRSGILSEDEYYSQQAAFQGSAARPAESESATLVSLDDEIEKRIAGLRREQKVSTSDDEIEARVRQLHRSQGSETGSRRPSTDGSSRQKVRFCSQCGGRQQPGDRFCRQCGEQLT